jgi:hypothetical protein
VQFSAEPVDVRQSVAARCRGVDRKLVAAELKHDAAVRRVIPIKVYRDRVHRVRCIAVVDPLILRPAVVTHGDHVVDDAGDLGFGEVVGVVVDDAEAVADHAPCLGIEEVGHAVVGVGARQHGEDRTQGDGGGAPGHFACSVTRRTRPANAR